MIGPADNPHRCVCAWCDALIRPGIEPTSHGICPPCLKVQMADIETEAWRHVVPKKHEAPRWIVARDTTMVTLMMLGLTLTFLGMFSTGHAFSTAGLVAIGLAFTARGCVPWRRIFRSPRP